MDILTIQIYFQQFVFTSKNKVITVLLKMKKDAFILWSIKDIEKFDEILSRSFYGKK
jgi:hypothetical protein